MQILRVLAVLVLSLLVTGCTCRRGAVGPNVPVADEGGPLKDINYAFDSYALDSAAKATLDANAAWLKSNASATTQIEGHCDERGTNEYNMALGANRARTALDYLRAQGVEASRMSMVSYGEELPLDPGHNEAAWAKNRRAHFNVK